MINMNWKNIFVTGASSGASVGFLISLNGFFDIGFGAFAGFVGYTLGSILLSAFGVKIISQKIDCCEPSLKHLVPVSFLTFFLPVVGPAVGAPSSGLDYVGILIIFGAIGGIFWSTPFALWSYYKSRGNQSIPSGDLSGNIPDSNQSDE